MAERRMISRTIVDSDIFLDMPQSTQNLYFHLNMRADDEGFVNSPKKVMRVIGANNNDLDILLHKRYVIAFESGVIVIKHWKLHNTIRKDRMKVTLYQDEKRLIFEKENGAYTDKQPTVNQLSTNCTHSIVESSIVEVSVDKTKKSTRFTPDLSFILDIEMLTIFDKWCKGKSKKYKNQIQVDAGYNKLVKLSDGNFNDAIEIVNNSLAGGWEGLFPLKDRHKKQEEMPEELKTVWD